MKYLRKFNESKTDSEEEFLKKIHNNIKYENDDILYYFSEFTDEYEYEYNCEYNIFNSDIIHRVFKLGRKDIPLNITFIKKISNNPIDEYIKFGESLKKYKICLNQFKTTEDDIKFDDDGDETEINFGKKEIKISLFFNKVIPDEIVNEYSVEFKSEEPYVGQSNWSTGLLLGSIDDFDISEDNINRIISEIDEEEVIDAVRILSHDYNNIDENARAGIEVGFEVNDVYCDYNDEQIIDFNILVYVNGELHDELSFDVTENHTIKYNFSTGEFLNSVNF